MTRERGRQTVNYVLLLSHSTFSSQGVATILAITHLWVGVIDTIDTVTPLFPSCYFLFPLSACVLLLCVCVCLYLFSTKGGDNLSNKYGKVIRSTLVWHLLPIPHQRKTETYVQTPSTNNASKRRIRYIPSSTCVVTSISAADTVRGDRSIEE